MKSYTKRQKMNKILVGIVEKLSEKTVKVIVSRIYRHEKYFKEIRVKKSYLAHNEINGVKVGDKVKIIQSKPISKRKSFIVKKVIS